MVHNQQKTKKFINSPEDAVDQSLQGVVLSTDAARFHESNCRVVLRSDLSYHLHRERVALIAGGGSGYIGRGFLTAAVAGNVFASPPSKHVQGALEATRGNGGAILFVINYTGDRLNFGLAAERFKAENGVVEVSGIMK
ncbi:hypothetical protein WR25_13823 [Diploscapter pachys]|uniref:DhaK domain-containing protein n=1 Tax=Diploscapter pachys TaxID=2018661 RepID=A0A2A2JWB2_9BILA|nr:hypothetical protein WR25_13823 [Diploscapter pachys]